MNQKNLDFLKEGLKYLGFGEALNSRLTQEIEKDLQNLGSTRSTNIGRIRHLYPEGRKVISQMIAYRHRFRTSNSREPIINQSKKAKVWLENSIQGFTFMTWSPSRFLGERKRWAFGFNLHLCCIVAVTFKNLV